MKKIYTTSLLAMLMVSISATAQTPPRPKTLAGPPQDGQTYVMVSAYSPLLHYSNLTDWDNALYLAQNVDFELTATDNGDGTWSFTREQGGTTYYMVTYPNDGNVRWNSTEPTKWIVENGDIDGFVKLKPGEGNADVSQLYYVHLNAGGIYVCVSCPGYGWYPDYAGGRVPNPDLDAEDSYLMDETGRYLLADHTSENWAFIAKDDWSDFTTKYTTYEDLKKLTEGDYDFEEYNQGFNATLTAALALYNNGDVTLEDAITISDMVKAKISFYELLIKAYDMDSDAKLMQAINKAQDSFDTVTSVSDVNTAMEALNQAILEFETGSGDYTGLLTNPSFEDLSAQGGNGTSGIAAPPVGWSVFINGSQVTTADEVRNAGIYNWHGVNDDSDGEGKDGLYAFGLWTGTVPNYQISQTISDLDCGTYTITAGLMVGSNDRGSRRTTQRLFGNLNTTYFGHVAEYNADLLDKAEVREFAELDELYTDRTLQTLSVRAYVYDGTLTLGLRTDGNLQAAMRETGNSAGGDGWFKLDNFRITKEGYIGSEAANVANTLLDAFKSYRYRYMYKVLTTKVQNLLSQFSTVSADTQMETINAMIISLTSQKDLLESMESSVAAYDRLADVIEYHYEQLNLYYLNHGADEYAEMIEDAESGYENGDYTEEQIDALIKQLEDTLDEVIKAGVAVGDYLNVIKNPSFEDLSAQGNAVSGSLANPPAGWTLKLNGTTVTAADQYSSTGANLNWCGINNGDQISATDETGTYWSTQYTDGTHLWGIWAAQMPEVELSQVVTGLPAGTYVLSCDMVVPNDWSGYSVTTQRIFANGYLQMFSNEGHYSELNETADMIAAKKLDNWNPDDPIKHITYAGWQSTEATDFDDEAHEVASAMCPYPMALTFGVDESGYMEFGFRTNNVHMDGTANKRTAIGWFKLDNFKLQYISTDIPTGIINHEAVSSAVQVVARKYYTADGREVATPQRGLTIVRNVMSDGSVKAVKVLTK